MMAKVYIRALGRQTQRHHEFQASLDREEDLAQKTKQSKQRGKKCKYYENPSLLLDLHTASPLRI